ncbi:MAG TPA: NTP transferase domain-containing protein [Candidatus Binatia bacterium]|jgi:molybdopterin-guanine dinucleotide biosynthesis protein A
MNSNAANSANRLTAIVIAAAAPDGDGAANARERLIEHLAWTLAQFPFRHFAVIGTPGNGRHDSGHVSVLADARPIATALRELPGGLFVVTGDMPFITTDMVEWLLGHDDPAADAVVPRYGQGVEPLFAIYNPGFLTHLDAALAEPGDALLNALDTARVRYVDTSEGLARSFDRVESEEACARAVAGLEKKFTDPSRL